MAEWFRTSFSCDKFNLVCLPQAGADTGLFVKWRADLGDDCQIVPASLPGRGARIAERVPSRLGSLADDLFAAFAQAVTGPYAILGASMGGWLGYELCLRIEGAGLPPPSALILIGSPAPEVARKLPDLSGLDQEQATAALLAFNPALGPALAYPELVELILPTIRADFENCMRYAPPRQAITTPIMGFAGLADPVADRSAMQGWSKWTSAKFRLIAVPGDHGLIDAPPIGLILALRDLAAQTLKTPALKTPAS